MRASWVAVSVRAGGLAGRRLGKARAAELARSASLGVAVAELARTPYGHDVHPGMSLRAAQQAVSATLLWHLRILAGWAPPSGANVVHRLAAAFEIANVCGLLERLSGRPANAPYVLGALSLAWQQIASAQTPSGVRTALARSPWGDPDSDEIAHVRSSMEIAWLRHIVEDVREARSWAAARAALLVARRLSCGLPAAPQGSAGRNLRAILGSKYEQAATVTALTEALPHTAAWVFASVEHDEDLWQAEARWWARVERDAVVLNARAQAGPGIVVGLAGLLAVDAWRTRGALELAARGGGDAAEWFDAAA